MKYTKKSKTIIISQECWFTTDLTTKDLCLFTITSDFTRKIK